MISARIRSLQEYLQHRKRHEHVYGNIKRIEDALLVNKGDSFTVKGFSYPANKTVNFKVDKLYAADGEVNWRERLVCPITKLNSRNRAAVHFIETELNI